MILSPRRRGGAEGNRVLAGFGVQSNFLITVIAFTFFFAEGMGGQQTMTVQLADILANPAQFHNKTIEVRGFLLHEFENSALYTSNKWQRTKGIWITPVVDLHTSIEAVNRHYVIVTGIFNANEHGHLGQFRGTLLVKKLVVEGSNKSGNSSGK